MQECIIICRVSTSTQSMGASLDAQESYLREYATRNKYSIKNTFRETGSVWQGRKTSKILDKFLNMIKNNMETTFLLLDVSRLCRCKGTGTKILDLLQQNSSKMVFVSQELIIPGMNARFEQQLSYAQAESEQLSNRVRLSKQYLKKNGMLFGKAKYGYRYVYKNGIKILKKHNREQRVMQFIKLCRKGVIFQNSLNKLINKISKSRDALQCYDENGKKVDKINECLTYREISDILNSFKVNCRGGKWNKHKVSRIYRQSLSKV